MTKCLFRIHSMPGTKGTHDFLRNPKYGDIYISQGYLPCAIWHICDIHTSMKRILSLELNSNFKF